MLNTSECLPTIITNCLKCSQEGVLVREICDLQENVH